MQEWRNWHVNLNSYDFAILISLISVNIPLGNYAMATWVTLSGGSAWGINLEGVIYRTGYSSTASSTLHTY